MNKNALKIFAIESRKELIEKIQIKAMEYGIAKDKIKNAQTVSSDSIVINGKPLSKEEKQQREKLIEKIKSINEEGRDGYNQIIEEVAYTWFNRFTALRFMEVNNYLPTKVRALSSATEGNVEPELIKEASNVDLPVDKQKIYEMKLNNNNMEGLFKYMIIAQCNSLNKILPYMFQEIGHYTELLLPNGLLNEGAFVRRLTDTKTIAESDWEDVEIIGWLYQYYISEKKDEVFAGLKKNIKITKENIPAATQLFTPDWIVKYMVENSLGRLWLEGHPDEELKTKWKYYLEEAEQEIEVQKQLAEIRNKNINPEQIKVFDCCMGSGHILVYLFEVLYDIYKSAGYTDREIPKLILTKNLYGLDIDDRASQLAYFAVMMKARSYNSRIFRERIDLNICSIQESNGFPKEAIEFLVNSKETEIEKRIHREDVEYLINVFNDAKEYGSILEVKEIDFDAIDKRIEEIRNGDITDIFELQYRNIILEKIPGLIKQAKILSQKYDVVVTNPPYMGKGMNAKLSGYVQKNYSDSKSDLFAVFIEKCGQMTKLNGIQAMITQHVFMFLGSYEKLRGKLMLKDTVNMAHLGARAFEEIGGEVVQTTTWVSRNSNIKDYKATYVRLVDFNSQQEKEKAFLSGKNKFIVQKENFSKIPGMPIAYWASDNFRKIFNNNLFYEFSISDGQNKTGNNDRFVRLFWEVSKEKIGVGFKWILYAKGGGYRKWSGNLDSVVNWSDEARKHYKQDHVSRIIPEYLWYKKGITWGLITSNLPSFRALPEHAMFDVGGSSIFLKDYNYFNYFIGLFNSSLFVNIAKIFNPTLNFQVKDIRSMPIVLPNNITKEKIDKLVSECINISEIDWNSFETSINFRKHPLIAFKDNLCKISDSFEMCSKFTDGQFKRLKHHEEELNKTYIDIYELKEEIIPDVYDKDITIRKADKEKYVKSFISYAIGCAFGRYSLDQDGLVYAGGSAGESKYKTFGVNEDNIIPILSDSYFEDDVVSKFVEFVKITFGDEALSENLEYIAETLGKRSNETAKETIRRYLLNDFYKDHLQTYKKRPIYWMFTSGKQKAFNCLIYMHRYDKTTLSRIRTDYLHELQDRLDTEKKALFDVAEGDYSTKEKSESKKKLTQIDKQIDELKKYDEVLHHMADMQIEIDLDDGVVSNYKKFKDILVKI
ncbi:BREX-1 system adenine-specific DNA-methyltransferase PglX [Clostridium tagluense]|uniref:BREX-1 system adenine-specific DNA-methyltransferase PglX n=1 Tax=Clostridium tagluense TaxID=360422 RepID=UPI001CF43CE1|nr:BREX-1 system adenine-specific DNA-methyltransferase PglX [Clostridium tagluense]MCB2299883.1 BREX-1 system adenine-specific DNA-methyltransferase PglX [Clostridium tagluense]